MFNIRALNTPIELILNEKLLQFIWQFALFQAVGLQLKDGRGLTIINRGKLNSNSGPDFSNAKIRIENTIWAGNIELHVKESDWKKHKHDLEPAYQNIILHVVYISDLREDAGNFPVLELKPYISVALMDYYTTLMQSPVSIPCAPHLQNIPDLVWQSWLQRMLLEKWELKFTRWQEILRQAQGNWSQLFYQVFSRNFGTKVNDDAFEELAKVTPLAVLAKHKDNLTHIEALLFGQAGMIPSQPQHPYEIELSIHYAFFKQKYGLQAMQVRQWKFLRMRPAGFPSIRIAQLAMILYKSEQLFASLLKVQQLDDIRHLFKLGVSDYWETHYTFQKEAKVKSPKYLGHSMQSLIWINTIVPIQYFYSLNQEGLNKLPDTVTKMQQAAPEENSVINTWRESGIKPGSAWDTQALLHLFRQYCMAKKCLECSIGLWFLKMCR